MLIETERLKLRKFSLNDTNFILLLLNEPAFIKNIADKGVRTIEDAKKYLTTGPLKSYEINGFGLWMIERKSDNQPIGISGLINRPTLDDIDIGYAILDKYSGKGYATEATLAAFKYGSHNLGLKRIVAVVKPDNILSIRVLKKIGLRFEKMIRLRKDAEEIKLFSYNAQII